MSSFPFLSTMIISGTYPLFTYHVSGIFSRLKIFFKGEKWKGHVLKFRSVHLLQKLSSHQLLQQT